MHKAQLTQKINYTIYKIEKWVVDWIIDELGISIEEFAHKIKTYQGRYNEYIYSRSWHNIVPLVLRATLANMIVWNTVTPTFSANYLAMWNGPIAPSNADTQLGNETIRWLFTNRFSIDNVAYLDKFWSSVEVGGNTYLEAGIFVDWTWTPNSWFLLSRIAINETMSATETLTVNASITIA
jgi:hypothetical protein